MKIKGTKSSVIGRTGRNKEKQKNCIRKKIKKYNKEGETYRMKNKGNKDSNNWADRK
jgi:hypothetical protein